MSEEAARLALEAEEAARLTDYKDGNKALEAEEAARLTDSKDPNLVSKDGNKAHGCQVAQCCQVSGTWLPGTGLPVHGGQGALDCTGSGVRAIMKKVHPSKQHKQQPQQQQTADASRGSWCILSNMIVDDRFGIQVERQQLHPEHLFYGCFGLLIIILTFPTLSLSTPYTTIVFVWGAGERPTMGAWVPNGPSGPSPGTPRRSCFLSLSLSYSLVTM